MASLSPRAKQILYAAVSEFVQTGEPVGSRTLSKRGIDLSPATIRNVLSDLEEAGFLVQPHTSAGRVPTDLAFRLFIDALMHVREVTREESSLIRTRFEDMEPGIAGLRETGKLLSELTGTASVIVAPRRPSPKLRHLRFLRTGPGEVLAVLVLNDGKVQNKFLNVQISERELERVHNLLDDVIEGRSLVDLREFFDRKRDSDSSARDPLRRTAFEIASAAVVEMGETPQVELLIEGRSKLLERSDFASPEEMKNVVSALDDEVQLLHLLEATLASKGAGVLLGHETGELGKGQLAVVSASYAQGSESQGSIGVIGPTRMDYPKVLPLVAATATAMSEHLGKQSAGAFARTELRSEATGDATAAERLRRQTREFREKKSQ
jgi:heat-inducible transcriptional repressor